MEKLYHIEPIEEYVATTDLTNVLLMKQKARLQPRDYKGRFLPKKGKVYQYHNSIEFMGETNLEKFREHAKKWGGTYMFCP